MIKTIARIIAFGAAIAVVCAAAVFFRQSSFWAVHTDPVELAYVSLAMKMGIHPGLSGYHPGGVDIRRRGVPETGSAGRILPVASPVEINPYAGRSFADWPLDSNPFYYKPPLLASLMVYSHHRVIGPKVGIYPVLAPDSESGLGLQRSKATVDVQFWALIVPFVSGILVILLTLVFGWRCFGPAVGFLAAVFIAAHPAAILASGRIWPEMTLTACLLAAVILFHYFVAIRSRAGCLLAGLAFGLAALTDHAALFALPAFWIWAASVREPREPFNIYFWGFLAGAAILCKTWFVDAGRGFGDFILKPSAAMGAGGDTLPAAAVKYFVSFPPLAFAIFSLLIFLNKILLTRVNDNEKYLVCVIGSFVLSLMVTRWLYSPASPWDERALIPVTPFLAILAAWVLCRLVFPVFSRKTAQ